MKKADGHKSTLNESGLREQSRRSRRRDSVVGERGRFAGAARAVSDSSLSNIDCAQRDWFRPAAQASGPPACPWPAW